MKPDQFVRIGDAMREIDGELEVATSFIVSSRDRPVKGKDYSEYYWHVYGENDSGKVASREVADDDFLDD